MRNGPSVSTAVAKIWEEERGRLFGVAYRLLGEVGEAEDVVQDAYLRLASVDLGSIDRPGAWLMTVTSRLSLDRLRSARARRERYVGPWLPEPLLTGTETDTGGKARRGGVADEVLDDVITAESVTFAFLVVLQSLSPAERVAFVLHDVFGVPFAEVGVALDRTEQASRKLAARARAAVNERRPRYEPDHRRADAVADAFLAATVSGDLDGLLDLLAPEVAMHSDGGGVVSTARNVLHGPDHVARFIAGLVRRFVMPGGEGQGWQIERTTVNGTPGVVVRNQLGAVDTVAAMQITDGHITDIHLVRNPDKLTHLT